MSYASALPFSYSHSEQVSSFREYLRGKYHCTVDLLFDWFGISCVTTDNFCFYLQNRLIKQEVKGTVILPLLVFPVHFINKIVFDNEALSPCN
jgi:hypothetical protein